MELMEHLCGGGAGRVRVIFFNWQEHEGRKTAEDEREEEGGTQKNLTLGSFLQRIWVFGEINGKEEYMSFIFGLGR